jgi:hypothetical protein
MPTTNLSDPEIVNDEKKIEFCSFLG